MMAPNRKSIAKKNLLKNSISAAFSALAPAMTSKSYSGLTVNGFAVYLPKTPRRSTNAVKIFGQKLPLTMMTIINSKFLALFTIASRHSVTLRL